MQINVRQPEIWTHCNTAHGEEWHEVPHGHSLVLHMSRKFHLVAVAQWMLAAMLMGCSKRLSHMLDQSIDPSGQMEHLSYWPKLHHISDRKPVVTLRSAPCTSGCCLQLSGGICGSQSQSNLLTNHYMNYYHS